MSAAVHRMPSGGLPEHRSESLGSPTPSLGTGSSPTPDRTLDTARRTHPAQRHRPIRGSDAYARELQPEQRGAHAMTTATRYVAEGSTSSTLYFGPWYRRSPFFEKTLEAGCSAYDIYNHMYLPGYYGDPVDEYWTLLNGVTLWDVGVERIVEITGPDSPEFVNRLTCRDLTKCAGGQGKYVLVTAEDGGIVND